MIDKHSALVAHCKDVTKLNVAKPHIQTATTVVKSLPSNKVTIPIKRKIPPNSNNETQLKFFPYKKTNGIYLVKKQSPSRLRTR